MLPRCRPSWRGSGGGSRIIFAGGSRGAVESGELPATTRPDALAGLVMAVIQGLSTLARDGATRDHLLAIAEAAMAAWPT